MISWTSVSGFLRSTAAGESVSQDRLPTRNLPTAAEMLLSGLTPKFSCEGAHVIHAAGVGHCAPSSAATIR
jgi:hypothetical protein